MSWRPGGRPLTSRSSCRARDGHFLASERNWSSRQLAAAARAGPGQASICRREARLEAQQRPEQVHRGRGRPGLGGTRGRIGQRLGILPPVETAEQLGQAAVEGVGGVEQC